MHLSCAYMFRIRFVTDFTPYPRDKPFIMPSYSEARTTPTVGKWRLVNADMPKYHLPGPHVCSRDRRGGLQLVEKGLVSPKLMKMMNRVAMKSRSMLWDMYAFTENAAFTKMEVSTG